MNPKPAIWIAILTIFLFVSIEALAQKLHPQQDQRIINSSIPVVPGSKGDVDGNGAVEILDLIQARDISIGRLINPDESQFFAGDLNSDSFIRIDDVESIRDILLQKTIPPPTIFSISSTSGMEGDQITIDGAGFDAPGAGNTVTFGGVSASIFSSTDTRLVMIVPTGAATGDVIVTVKGQSSNGIAFQVTVSQNSPFISNITPAAPLRQQEVTIEGERFSAVQGNSQVKFGNATAQSEDIISWSDTEIMVKVPTDAFPGIVTVTVDAAVSNGYEYYVVVVEVTAPDSSDIVQNADGIQYVRNEIILDFNDTVTLGQISDFLSQHDLTQIGLIYRTRMIQARIDDGRGPFQLAEDLTPDNLLQGAFPSVLFHRASVVSESFPDRILNSYDPTSGTFITSQTKAWWHHFTMQTFAGHRLVEFIQSQNSGFNHPDVRVAVIDAGLGDGSTSNPAEFQPNRIVQPTLVDVRRSVGLGSGLVDLKDIPDQMNSHGSGVAGLAAGSGIASLGTGKHINLRPIKTYWTFAMVVAGALEIALQDPYIKVVNLSIGSAQSWAYDNINSATRGLGLGIYQNEIDDVLNNGKIIVTAAGNEAIDTNLSAPASLAPAHHPRRPGDRNILNVAATTINPGLADGPEEKRWNLSNYGNKISVSAPGDFTGQFSGGLLSRNYERLNDGVGGTSNSAPLVSGLAGEMILIDKIVVGSGKRSVEMSPFQIIRIIEMTADDLGNLGFDEHFGNGRINVWKALLATVNGGVALDDPEWYGFEIRASSEAPTETVWDHLADHYRSARIYIDDQPLTDDSNISAPAKEISLQKRVPHLATEEGEGLIPLPLSDMFVEKTDRMCDFSITRDEISADGSNLKMLQIRKAGWTSTSPPLFEMPIDLVMFKTGVPNFVSYDDYVFTIEVPRVVEMKSIQDGQILTLTKNMNGNDITYPIGAYGGRLELSISFPEFTPTVDNTDIEFFPLDYLYTSEPEDISGQAGAGISHKFETDISDRAATGPVMIRTTPVDFGRVISFLSPDSLIIAKSVGLNLDGTEPDDPVTISIHVPRFDATTSNTKIKFPGSNPEVAPDEVTVGTPPDVTHVLHTTIPANLEEGMIKITITVDNGEQLEFDGGLIALFDQNDYSGTMTLTTFTTPYYNGLPPDGQRTVPVRFTLNKNLEDEYFFTASMENWPFAIGPSMTAVLDGGSLQFDSTWIVGGMESNRSISAFLNNGYLTGTWSITMRSGSSIMLQLEASFDTRIETEVGHFNGTFFGRAERRNEGEGDPGLLKGLKDSILPAEMFLHYPLAFVQVDQLTALTFVFNQSSGSGGSTSERVQQSLLEKINDLTSNPGPLSLSNNYVVLNYYVGSLDGNQFTFHFDDAGRYAPYFYQDSDPNNNIVTTYDLTKNGDNLTGTITLMLEEINIVQQETKTASIVFDYSGQRQKEDEDNVTIFGVTPPPELGFPDVTGNVVTLARVKVAYNYVYGTEGTVVLRAFKNNNTSDILAEMEVPIQLLINTGGQATFDDFVIPNVGEDVTTVSIYAGLKPEGSETLLVESNVISYAR